MKTFDAEFSFVQYGPDINNALQTLVEDTRFVSIGIPTRLADDVINRITVARKGKKLTVEIKLN